MDKGKVLKDDEEVVITGKELAKHRDICRKEGVIEELKDTLTTLKAIDSELDRRNVDMMLKTLIKIKEKRLKELNKGGNE
jgi:hypothetical protein